MLRRMLTVLSALAVGLGLIQPTLVLAARHPSTRLALNMSVAEKVRDSIPHVCSLPKASLAAPCHATLQGLVRMEVPMPPVRTGTLRINARRTHAPGLPASNRIRAP
ncbi:MAG TPA: hypothetical protein VN397_00530 [Candidatus Methylomirabilis sp.]|nr:hypothetical protein [Candidatus Methylomirabilis sp.]